MKHLLIAMMCLQLMACQSQTKEGPKPKATNSGTVEPVAVTDPMSAAEAWCAQQDTKPTVLRLLKSADKTYVAVVAAKDEPGAAATQLTIVFDKQWSVTDTQPAKGDAFWPSL